MLIFESIESTNSIFEYSLKNSNHIVLLSPTIWSYDINQYFKHAYKDTMFFGSCNTAVKLERNGFPNLFFHDNLFHSKNRSVYSLNFSSWYVPFGELKSFLKNFTRKTVFIRPDSPFKSFSGQVVSVALIDDFIDAYKDQIKSKEFVLVGTKKEILQEWRHVIYKNNVITSSEYKRNGNLYIKNGAPEQACRIAKWHKDHKLNNLPFVVVDTCLTEDGEFKVIECNSFNTCGFYACDASIIIDAVEDYLK